MRRLLLPAILAATSVLAHEGEKIERHSALQRAFDLARDRIVDHGVLVFGTIALLALIVFWAWIRKNTPSGPK